MARKRVTDNSEYVPVKLRRGTLKVAKALAGWQGMTLADYIGNLVAEEAKKELPQMLTDLKQLARTGSGDEE